MYLTASYYHLPVSWHRSFRVRLPGSQRSDEEEEEEVACAVLDITKSLFVAVRVCVWA